MASDSARREDHFQKKICSKRTFPSNFVKLVSKILYLFLAEKWSFVVLLFCCFVVLLFCIVLLFCCFVVLLFCCFVVLLFCCFVVLLFCCFVVCCNFVRSWLTFFLIEAFVELRKMFLRKKLFDVRFGNCLTPKVPRFCRFTKMQLT